MSALLYTVPPAIAILVILWLLLRRRSSASEKVRGGLADFHTGNVAPTHYQFFPQIRQALSAADDKYLNESAPPEVARQARRVRRAVARDFFARIAGRFFKSGTIGTDHCGDVARGQPSSGVGTLRAQPEVSLAYPCVAPAFRRHYTHKPDSIPDGACGAVLDTDGTCHVGN